MEGNNGLLIRDSLKRHHLSFLLPQFTKEEHNLKMIRSSPVPYHGITWYKENPTVYKYQRNYFIKKRKEYLPWNMTPYSTW
jgi:hypothetical protein